MAARRLIRRRRRGRPGVGWIVAGAAVMLVALAWRWALPPLALPAPTGTYAVGTTVVEWTDPTRSEPATDDPFDRRFVVAQFWYPAVDGARGARAPYLGRDDREAAAVAAGLARAYGVPELVFGEAARARTVARLDAAPAVEPDGFPVVLFSPGLQGIRQQNTAWALELASHGYVVVALDHPYDSAVVVRDDGTEVRSAVRATGDDAEDQRRADGWAALRAADLRFALTRLDGSDAGRFGLDRPRPAVRLDLDRVAVVGHSLGGAAALQAAETDDRFDAVIDLDGYPRGSGVGEHRPPVLAVVAGEGTGDTAGDARYAAAVTAVLEDSTRPSARLVVPGAAHLSFTDAALFLPPVPSLFGSIGRSAGVRASTTATLAFLEVTLRDGDPEALTARLAELGTVTTYGR